MLPLLLALTLAAPRSVAVMPLRAKGDTQKKLTDVLDDLLLSAVHSKAPKGMRVVGKSDIDAMLGLEKTKDLAGCDGQSCVAEIAGALGVDSILYGTVGKLGAKHVVALNWILQKDGGVLARTTTDLGKNEESFDAELAKGVDVLFGATPQPVKATLAGYYAYGTNNFGFAEITEAKGGYTIAASWLPGAIRREPTYDVRVTLADGKLAGTWTNNEVPAVKEKRWAALVSPDLNKIWVNGVDDPPPAQSWNGVELTRAPATLDLTGIWRYGPGIIQAKQTSDDLTLDFTWPAIKEAGPHFRVTAKRQGYRLRGTYKTLFTTPGATTGEWNAAISSDTKTFIVLRAHDPGTVHHWDGLTATR